MVRKERTRRICFFARFVSRIQKSEAEVQLTGDMKRTYVAHSSTTSRTSRMIESIMSKVQTYLNRLMVSVNRDNHKRESSKAESHKITDMVILRRMFILLSQSFSMYKKTCLSQSVPVKEPCAGLLQKPKLKLIRRKKHVSHLSWRTSRCRSVEDFSAHILETPVS